MWLPGKFGGKTADNGRSSKRLWQTCRPDSEWPAAAERAQSNEEK
jgi:hypothetical protein